MKIRFPSWSFVIALTVTTACATPAPEILSGAMMDYCTQFAATGDPNRGGLTEWPEFSETVQFLRFAEQLEIDTELHTTGFALYNTHQTARQ